jgi:hypothetical protein
VTYHVEVTEEDIRGGVRKACTVCPVARALNRATEMIWWVPGGVGGFQDEPEVQPYWIDLPATVKQFIIDFDAGRPVSPIEFDIEVPD